MKAHVAASPKDPETLDYTGDGVIIASKTIISRWSLFSRGYYDGAAQASPVRSPPEFCVFFAGVGAMVGAENPDARRPERFRPCAL